MSTQRQDRRGTQAENDAFTGAAGETVYATDTERLINHDGATTGGIPVPNFKDIQNNAFIAGAVGGTANALTLTTASSQTAYANYQEFLIKPTANNTGTTTVNVDGIGVANIKKDDGSGVKTALAADDLKSGIPLKVIYDGTDFIAQLGGGGAGGIIDSQTFLSSGTWTKPASGTYAWVRLWGAGASGGRGALNTNTGNGGGGGSYNEALFLLSDLASTEAVTLGAGGASITTGSTIGVGGGTSDFGTLIFAYGGGGGGLGGGIGGGGGGRLSAGIVGSTMAVLVPASITALLRENTTTLSTNGHGGLPQGGYAGNIALGLLAGNSVDGGGGGAPNNDSGLGKGGSSINGGGGGGGERGSGAGTGGDGGDSVNGGGGGGGGGLITKVGGAGGTSSTGGAGGAGANSSNNATAGTQPAGGGGGSEAGASGAGGAGKCIVIVI